MTKPKIALIGTGGTLGSLGRGPFDIADYATLGKVIAREWPVISASAFIMILMVIMTASLGYVFEHEAQPEKFDNIPNSVYWAVITLASVGYGDISPITPVGRFMTVVMALLGIGIFAIPAALLASAFGDQLHKERELLKKNLRDMMKDGHLDENEITLLRTEAKRLHITIEELNALLEHVHDERLQAQQRSVLPLHVIAERWSITKCCCHKSTSWH